MHATCPTHLILFDLIIVIIFGEKCKQWSSWLCNFLQPPVTSSLLGPNLITNIFYFFISILLIPYSYSVKVFHFSLDLYTISRTPWTSDWPITRPLPKYRTTQTQKNVHTHTHTHTHTKHPCPKWDSNPWSQRPSEQRQFMPETARQLWPANYTKLHGLSPQANYTDRATAACRRS
jgi:hypothetical protein